MSTPTPATLKSKMQKFHDDAVKPAIQPEKVSKPESSNRVSTKNSAPKRGPKPQRNSTKVSVKDSKKAAVASKKPFMRPEHLTQRLSNNEALLKLRDGLNKENN